MGRPVYNVGQLIKFMLLKLDSLLGCMYRCSSVFALFSQCASWHEHSFLRGLHLRNADDFRSAVSIAIQLANGATEIAKAPSLN